MRTLKFIVTGQHIEKDPICDFSGLVPGTKGYLRAAFSFSKEWNGCGKIAEFRRFSTSEPVPVKIVGDACIIPAEVTAKRSFKVTVIGVKKEFKIITDNVEVKQGA